MLVDAGELRFGIERDQIEAFDLLERCFWAVIQDHDTSFSPLLAMASNLHAMAST